VSYSAVPKKGDVMVTSVKDFFDKMTDIQRDVFASVLTDLQATASPEKIKRLTEYHSKLKDEIDQINSRREALGGVLSNLETLLRYVNHYMRTNGTNLEISMFKTNLEKFAADLRAEVSAMKPEAKLDKKHDLSRKIESLSQRQSFAGRLTMEVVAGKSLPEQKSNLGDDMHLDLGE
jgi:hypothetical protein